MGRLTHYFTTYKLRPDQSGSVVVNEPYGRAHAEAVVTAALADYLEDYPPPVGPRLATDFRTRGSLPRSRDEPIPGCPAQCGL